MPLKSCLFLQTRLTLASFCVVNQFQARSNNNPTSSNLHLKAKLRKNWPQVFPTLSIREIKSRMIRLKLLSLSQCSANDRTQSVIIWIRQVVHTRPPYSTKIKQIKLRAKRTRALRLVRILVMCPFQTRASRSKDLKRVSRLKTWVSCNKTTVTSSIALKSLRAHVHVRTATKSRCLQLRLMRTQTGASSWYYSLRK